MSEDHITLKWGTLKSWKVSSPAAKAAAQKYCELGYSLSAMLQRDTPEQKDLICVMIDESEIESVYLDWDGREVSKEEAKRYVMEYGANPIP